MLTVGELVLTAAIRTFIWSTTASSLYVAPLEAGNAARRLRLPMYCKRKGPRVGIVCERLCRPKAQQRAQISAPVSGR
jgi:hypothetical protein